MTKEEAIARIKKHMIVHKMNEPRAIYISEALNMAIKALEQSKWIPVTDPLNELPKDRHLLVTVEYEVWPGEKCRYVTELYYDMTEWSEINDAKNTIAYRSYPEPYKESEDQNG